jgi:hypothetical protein
MPSGSPNLIKRIDNAIHAHTKYQVSNIIFFNKNIK